MTTPAAAEIGAWHVRMEAKGTRVIPWHRLTPLQQVRYRVAVALARRRLERGERLVVAPMQRLPGDGQPVPLAYATTPVASSSMPVVTTPRPRRAAPRSVRRSTTHTAQANAPPPGSPGSPGSPSRRGDSAPCPNGWRR